MALDSLNKITIDVSDPLTAPVVRAVQEDIRSRFVEITLVRNGQPLDIPVGAYGMIGIRRPDGTYCLYDETEDETSAITITDNVVTIYLSQEALSVAGAMYTSVSLYSSDGMTRLTAFAFTVAVEPTAVPSGAVPSTYINILQGLVEDAVDAANRAEQAAAQVGNPVGYDPQTPTSAQQAQARTNIGAMASDATPTPAVHASTHAIGGTDALTPADIGAMRVYRTVTDLGLTSGSATIAGAWSAMSESTALICPSSDFAAGQIAVSGMISIVKRNSTSGTIHNYSCVSTNQSDYRMFVNSGTPTGTWRIINRYGTGTVSASQGTIDGTPILVADGRTAFLYVAVFYVSYSTSWTELCTISDFAPSSDVIGFGVTGGYDIAQVKISSQGVISIRAASASSSAAIRISMTWIV